MIRKLRLPRVTLNPLAVQGAAVVAAGFAVVAITLFTSGVVERSSRHARNDSNAALLAWEIRAEMDQVALLQLDSVLAPGSEGEPSARISLQDAIAAHDAVAKAAARATELHQLIGSETTLQILGATGEARVALDAYLAAQTPQTFADLQTRLSALRILTAFEIPELSASAQSQQATLGSATSLARVAIIIAAITSAGCVGAATLVIGRRLRHALQSAESEKARLLQATRAMQRRNDQFAALYQIGSEVSESLSMRYVVQTTVREARNLVGADVVAVRRIVNGALVLAGTEQDVAADVAALGVVTLGSGLVGRAAKRGKTIRIDSGAAAQMCPEEHVPGIESGIVVPLIVGARVVGTLGCWSRRENHFDTDDERILEMMATQVATAIVSADTHEQSERSAHSDALTTLPNRRQLNDDLQGALLEATLSGKPHAIAMIDIDNFKRFNDDYGHKVGDITLQKVAEVLKSSIRDQDRVYRFGGEEFLVIFAGVDAENAMKLAERARAAVERAPLTGETLQPIGPITISIGIALFPDHGNDMATLIDLADRAMYGSKQGGRNRVTLASGEFDGLASAA
ncbi:MAG: sensor domain-containing diguanylate cyclase [Chloroflexi bacterium]|nr:sensor domain-containing diguanylate cyclase [Chloroflexota bacterium]